MHAANASWLGHANEQAMLEYVPRGQMDARAQFNCSGAETSTPCPYFMCVFRFETARKVCIEKPFNLVVDFCLDLL